MTPQIQKTKRAIIYKTVGDVEIKADVYTHVSGGIDVNTPVMLCFHGGGLVAYFRHLPQITGKEIVEDAQDAYAFIRERLWGILNNVETTHSQVMHNVIVSGASGGGAVAFTSAHYLKPQPLALLIYYGQPNSQTEWLNSSRIHAFGVGPGTVPLLESQVSQFLSGPVTTGTLNVRFCFDLAMLNDDLSENKEWVQREDDSDGKLNRVILYPWLLQTNGYPKLIRMVDKTLDDESWKNYPKTVLVHGTEDIDTLYQYSLDVANVIGPHKAQLFSVEGKAHGFDARLFLGDPGLKEVEQAWSAIEEIVKQDGNLESNGSY